MGTDRGFIEWSGVYLGMIFPVILIFSTRDMNYTFAKNILICHSVAMSNMEQTTNMLLDIQRSAE